SLLRLNFYLEKSRDGVLPTVHFFLPASLPSLQCVFSLILATPCVCREGAKKTPPFQLQPKGEVSNLVIMLPRFRNLLRQRQNSAVSTLIILFLAWKLLLLAVAFLTPAPSYDSSTDLLFQSQALSATPQLKANEESWDFARLARRLTRWDAIYFINIA